MAILEFDFSCKYNLPFWYKGKPFGACDITCPDSIIVKKTRNGRSRFCFFMGFIFYRLII